MPVLPLGEPRQEDNCSSRHEGEMEMVSWLSSGLRCSDADLHPVLDDTSPANTRWACAAFVLPPVSRLKGGSNIRKTRARYPWVNFHTLKLSPLSDVL